MMGSLRIALAMLSLHGVRVGLGLVSIFVFYFHRAFFEYRQCFHQLNALVIKTLKYSKSV